MKQKSVALIFISHACINEDLDNKVRNRLLYLTLKRELQNVMVIKIVRKQNY